MNYKHATDRVFAAINDGTYDPAEGCRWPRDVIAAYTELSEKTVSRATKQLEAEGRLKVHRPRKRGECNTYFVAAWNPPLRKRTIARLKKTKPAVFRLRESKCPPIRTAAPSRARTAVASTETRALLPRCTQFENQPLWSRGAREIRRSSMDQRRRPQHITVVPDLTCPSCQELARELEAKTEIVRKLSVSNTELAEELSGAMEAARATGKENANLKRAVTRQARESARAEQVEAVIEHWKKHRPKTKASSFPPGGKNWQTIEKALSLMAEDEDGPVQACREAIDGLHIAPWEAYGRRYMKDGPNRTLRNRLEHALGDETRIERCRGIVRRVREDGADRAWELCLVAQATYDALTELTLEQLGERRRGPVEQVARFTVDGLRVRADGR